MSMRKLAERLKAAGSQALSFQVSQGLAGTPFSVGGWETKEDRFPGMRRWVDRRILERAMSAHDAGIPETEFVDSETDGGTLRDVAIGAGLAAPGVFTLGNLLSRHDLLPSDAATFMRKQPLAVLLGSALLGAGAGAAYHQRSEDQRREHASEAYRGTAQEVARYPRQRASALPGSRSDQSSAAASTPLILSTAPSVV